MKHKMVLIVVAAIVCLALAAIVFGQIYSGPKDVNAGNQNSRTATPTSTPSPTPSPTSTVNSTSTPSVTPAPQENVTIDTVSIDNATAASVTASSHSGQDIIITKIILKDNSGNTLATDDSISRVLPGDGTSVKITINQNNADFDLGGTFTLTIVTSDGISYTSQKCSPLFY